MFVGVSSTNIYIYIYIYIYNRGDVVSNEGPTWPTCTAQHVRHSSDKIAKPSEKSVTTYADI